MKNWKNSMSSSLQLGSNWICEICNLEIPLELSYCLCGGPKYPFGKKYEKTKQLFLIGLPNVLLLHICQFLIYSEAIYLQILSSFWFKLLTSENARNWAYFPILIDIQFSHTIIVSKMYDFLEVTSNDSIATRHRRSEVSDWSCWSFKGVFLHNITSQISDNSPLLVQDKEKRGMALFDRHTFPQRITRFWRYFDSQTNVHWVAFQSLDVREKYDFCQFWNKNIILGKPNSIDCFEVEREKLQKIWQINLPINLQSKNIISSIQIYSGLVWILYPHILLCYN